MSAGAAARRLGAAVLATACAAPVPEPAAVEPGWTPREMIRVPQIDDVQVSPDGTRVAYTVAEPVLREGLSEYRVHVHVDQAGGGSSRQLTRGRWSCSNPRWSPDGEWIAYQRRRTRDDVWLVPAAGGNPRQVTRSGGVVDFRWSPDGSKIAFLAPDPRPTGVPDARRAVARLGPTAAPPLQLWVVEVVRGSSGPTAARRLSRGRRSLERESEHRGGFDWSPDGARIVYAHQPQPGLDHAMASDLSVVDVVTGESAPLVSSARGEYAPRNAPDGRGVVFLRLLSSYPFTAEPAWVGAGGGPARSLPATPGGTPHLVGPAAGDGALYVTEPRGTGVRLLRLEAGGSAWRELPAGSAVVRSVDLDRTGSHLGFVGESVDRAPEVYRADLRPFRPVRVTDFGARLPPHPLGEVRRIRWPAPDGLEIEGLLYLPVGYGGDRRVPLLVELHGGPQAAFAETFAGNPWPYVHPVAAFVQAGFAVLRPNPRGSSGYGVGFLRSPGSDLGGVDAADVEAGVDHVVGLGIADPERLGLLGWSYGGFLTVSILARVDRFAAASALAPITNLYSFAGTTDLPGWLPAALGSEAWQQPGAYLDRSAVRRVGRIGTPLLLLHGEEDARVPPSQSLELYTHLSRRGADVELVLYPRMGHAPGEPGQLLDIMERTLDWFVGRLR